MTSAEARQLRNASTAVAVVFALIVLAALGWPAVLAFAVWGLIVAAIHALYFQIQADDLRSLEARRRSGSSAWREEGDESEAMERYMALPRFRSFWQLLLLGGAAVLMGWLLWRAWRMPVAEASTASLQLGIVLSIAVAVLLSLLGRYAVVLGAKLETADLNGVAQLARFSFWVGGALAASLGILLYAQRDLRVVTGRTLVLITAALVLDALVRAMLRSYRPATARKASGPVGDSLLLALFLRRSNPWDEVSTRMEGALGVKLGDTWAFRFLRRAFAPLVLASLLLAWLATAATVVPVGHAGVRVERGRFVSPPVGPGWHWSAPWPFASIELVPTKRVDEILLGFERDTGQPILWAERHYEGEKNILVGDGDELLTIAVPVHYRIHDPLAYLMTTSDARATLQHLAYRELLRVTSARDSFAIMTDQRADVSATLRTGLQRAVDAHGLGLEIVWVGLRDIHPPVAVTPSFQDVISAEEERQTMIELARAYAARALPEAKQEAGRMRATAEAAGEERTLAASGEALRFRQLAGAQKAQPDVFRSRLRLEALEAALAGRRKIVVATDKPPRITMDARRKTEVGSDGEGEGDE
ncbi:MAG: protease modulator HflK [Planctomycetota bacterium]